MKIVDLKGHEVFDNPHTMSRERIWRGELRESLSVDALYQFAGNKDNLPDHIKFFFEYGNFQPGRRIPIKSGISAPLDHPLHTEYSDTNSPMVDD